jgi:hypothetical protein
LEHRDRGLSDGVPKTQIRPNVGTGDSVYLARVGKIIVSDILPLVGGILTGIAAVISASVTYLKYRHAVRKDQAASGTNNPVPQRNSVYVLGAVAVVLAVVSAGLFFRTDGPGREPSTTATASASSPAAVASEAPVAIEIGPLEHTVPECMTVPGTGDVPDNRFLWLIVRSGEPKYYYFPTQPNADDHTWLAPNVQFGTADDRPGEPFVVSAALLDDAASRRINAADYSNGVEKLPSGIKPFGDVQVQRSSDRKPCPK